VTAPDGFVVQLRGELLAAAARVAEQRRRRARRAAVGTTVAAVAAAVVLVVLPRPDAAAADVVVRRTRGAVEITLVDLEHRPDRIEAAAREAGVDLEVRAVPVGPSSVGRFVGLWTSTSLGPAPRRLHDGPEGFRGFSVPEGWPGSLRLLVGAPARRDEPYARASDALAPGEPLACRPVVGRRAAELARSLPRQGIHLRFIVRDVGVTHVVERDDVERGPWAGWVATQAESTARGEVVVDVVAPGPTAPHPAPEEDPCP
jgi:hypothetical protein